MHFCQSCSGAVALEPRGGAARCPVCGFEVAAAVEPLFVVTGASGSGKTAVLGPLARLLAGRCATFDVDLLIDAAAELSHPRPIRWPAFRAAWLAVTQGVAQAGMPTVLLGPLIPEHLEDLPARRWVGDIGGGSNPGTPASRARRRSHGPRCTKLVHVDAEGLGPPRVDPAPQVHPASLADGRLAARGVTCRRRRGPRRAGAGRRRPRRGSSRRSTG